MPLNRNVKKETFIKKINMVHKYTVLYKTDTKQYHKDSSCILSK